MVRVDQATVDKKTAWRIRDALASHPLLGGCTARIDIVVSADDVLLTGWVSDEKLTQTVSRLAVRAAGKRPVLIQLQTSLTKNIHDACLAITER